MAQTNPEVGIFGVELATTTRTTVLLPVEAQFEHGLVVLAGGVTVGNELVRPGVLAYLGRGRDELALDMRGDSRVLLVGGRPCTEDLLMWWNFVARTRAEIEQAWTEWERGTARFGGSPLTSRASRHRVPAGCRRPEPGPSCSSRLGRRECDL